MIARRNVLLAGVVLLGMGMGGSSSCSVDQQKVVDAIRMACGIAVPAATVAQIIGLDPTMSISAIVNLICSGYQTAKAEGKLGAEPAKNNTVVFTVYVSGKPVSVTGVVQ